MIKWVGLRIERWGIGIEIDRSWEWESISTQHSLFANTLSISLWVSIFVFGFHFWFPLLQQIKIGGHTQPPNPPFVLPLISIYAQSVLPGRSIFQDCFLSTSFPFINLTDWFKTFVLKICCWRWVERERERVRVYVRDCFCLYLEEGLLKLAEIAGA